MTAAAIQEIEAPKSSMPSLTKSQVHRGLKYEPHWKQTPVHACRARFRVLIAGRRWGKSLLASKEATPEILKAGTRGWVVSRNYELTNKVFREVYKDLVMTFGLKDKLVSHSYSSPYKLVFNWGPDQNGDPVENSEIVCGTADNPDSLLGEGLNWLIFDEFATCKQSVWEQYLRPTLTDKEGWALFIGTPRGYNWGYDLYVRGKDPTHPDWRSFKSPSWENPTLPASDLAEAKRTLTPAFYAQEYGADFTQMAGRVYPQFDENIHIIPEWQIRIDPSWDRYRAIDFGYENPFTCIWIARNPIDDTYIVYDEYYVQHMTVENHAKYLISKGRLDEVTNAYLPAFDMPRTAYEWTVCDPSGRGARATLLEHGIPTVGPKIKSVLPGLETIRAMLMKRDDGKPTLRVSNRCVNLIKEFLLYSYPDSGDSEDPKKENDHALDALRYWATLVFRGTARQLESTYN